MTATLLILASSCTTSSNQEPIITSLEAEPESTTPLGSVQVMCTASDSDGDELEYDWSASGGKVDGVGANVTWTAPASEDSYDVAVTVTDGHGGEVMDHVAITVRVNNPPAIASLTADAKWAIPSGSVRVTCNASDPDGDKLSYNWTATAGDISGTGAVVNWTAPQTVGTYSIAVVVRDGYGGEATKSLSLSVTPGAPPSIEKLCVIPKGHIYLRESNMPGCDYDVWMTKEYDIECVASNASGELFYEWSYDDGQISGAGSKITWTAPSKKSTDTVPVEVIVTVVVSDPAGNRIARHIVFYMASCTCGSWGLELGCT